MSEHPIQIIKPRVFTLQDHNDRFLAMNRKVESEFTARLFTRSFARAASWRSHSPYTPAYLQQTKRWLSTSERNDARRKPSGSGILNRRNRMGGCSFYNNCVSNESQYWWKKTMPEQCGLVLRLPLFF
ncbi:hypothetical protein ElyMa_002621500 [Elysia marginata]|uniref:Uncharacterized protein n=1 Tax=Elysia marginata TaxID=1093978 RepID=A0AAV4H4Y0_9GAST|nr:hypothetical protein ElyMa_002621500 [Elysia marginata]